MPGNADKLVDMSGKPLVPEPHMVVIKVPKDVVLPPQLLSRLSQLLKVTVVELPMSCEVLEGKLAVGELQAIHSNIHEALKDLGEEAV